MDLLNNVDFGFNFKMNYENVIYFARIYSYLVDFIRYSPMYWI